MGTSVQGLEQNMKVATFTYDFAVDGGAIGTTIILNPGAIPKLSVILGGFVYVNTALTSGGSATISMGLETSADIKALTAVATYSLAALLVVIPVFTVATEVVTTVARGLNVGIAVATLLTGRFTCCLLYVPIYA